MGHESIRVYTNILIVYRHIRLDKKEPFYIGIGKSEKRAYTKKGRNRLWKIIVQKTEYKVEVLFEDVDLDFANKKEIELIKLYGKISDGNGPLANISDGGDGVHGLFGEKNPSFGKKGPLSPLYGRTLTDEQKEKLNTTKKLKDYL